MMKKIILSAALLLSFSAADIAIGPRQASVSAADIAIGPRQAFAAGGGAEKPRVILTVNGKAITADELTKRLWWVYAAQEIASLGDERLVLEEAARLKVTVDEKQVAKKYEELRADYKNNEKFEKNLKSMNCSVQELKIVLRNAFLIRNLALTTKNITVTDTDIQKTYDNDDERFTTPESVHLREIFVKTGAEADGIYTALSSGADFAKLASLKSTDEKRKNEGGDMGFVPRHMLQPELWELVFALKPGQYTKPLATHGGYSILKLEELRPPEKIKYETAKEGIKANLLDQLITQELANLVVELRSKAKFEAPK